MFNFNINIQKEIRNFSMHTIKKMISLPINNSTNTSLINNLLNITKKFIGDNSSIMFTRAYKGNVTVALDKALYMDKVIAMLSDKDTYNVLNKDPIRTIINTSKKILVNWKRHNFIDDAKYKRLMVSDGVLPRAYALPKIHKTGIPFRIIVSTIDSPLYPFASFLQSLISSSIPKAKSHIENSFQLVERLQGLRIDKNRYTLISLDVISLFTNTPIEIAIESITRRWELISQHCVIPKTEFIKALEFILKSTIFKFNDTIFEQKFATPKGSPLSPIIADLVLRDLEEEAIKPFYYRYVDDTV